jgi:putative ATP-dependent endonuclease of the OLD family
MFYCNKLILVEGIEDVAYISTYIELCDCMNEFRRTGCHIVPVGGKSELIRPICIANILKIPFYVICDADTNKENKAEIAKLEASSEIVDKNKLKKIMDEITKHKKDNQAILNLMGYKDHSNWPDADVWMTAMTMWKANITQTIDIEMGADWKTHEEKALSFYGNAAGLKKNPLAVSRALESAWEAGIKSTSLIKLVHCIVGKNAA